MSLNIEDYKRIAKQNKEFMDDWHKQFGNNPPESEAQNKEDFYGDCDHPDAMENGTAIILYIIVMLIGAIFNDKWLIWIVATGIFLKFITRHTK